jgi:hypothetical protein
VAPEALTPVVHTAGLGAALSTARDLPGRGDVDHEAGGFEVETSDDKMLDGQENSE